LAPSDSHLSVTLKNHLGGKRFADDENAEMKAQQWLRQQSDDFCAMGFDALVKRQGKCINARGGCQEINAFSRFEYHMFHILYPFVTYLLTLPLLQSMDSEASE
jgi:hypothetical protein